MPLFLTHTLLETLIYMSVDVPTFCTVLEMGLYNMQSFVINMFFSSPYYIEFLLSLLGVGMKPAR